MAIKINGKDLAKRIINWVEVEKVMANGSQIRPTSTPPTPTDIHIHADFTNYSMPSWWIYGSQNFTYTDKWLLSTETWQGSSYVQYRPNWQTPTFDLSSAKRIVTVWQIYYVPSPNPPHNEFIYWQWWNFVFAAVAGCSSVFDPEINSISLKFPLDSTYADWASFMGWTEGYATGTLEANLESWLVEYSLQGVWTTLVTLVDTLSASQLATLKQQTEFLVSFRAQAIVSTQDIYIYY